MTALRVVLALPVLLILVLFALSNQQPVRIVLWPTDFTLELPFSVAVLAISAVFFIAGAVLAWGASLGARRRAKRAEDMARQLRLQIEAMRAQHGRPSLALPPPG